MLRISAPDRSWPRTFWNRPNVSDFEILQELFFQSRLWIVLNGGRGGRKRFITFIDSFIFLFWESFSYYFLFIFIYLFLFFSYFEGSFSNFIFQWFWSINFHFIFYFEESFPLSSPHSRCSMTSWVLLAATFSTTPSRAPLRVRKQTQCLPIYESPTKVCKKNIGTNTLILEFQKFQKPKWVNPNHFYKHCDFGFF